MKKPIILIICDGMGHREEAEHNAVFLAPTPNLDYFWSTYPHAILEAAGEAIGLPNGQMGTSESNHLIIGSGRIFYQNLVKINHAVKTGELSKNKVVQDAFAHVKKYNSILHLKFMVSPGGVHGHMDHAQYLIKLAQEAGIKNIYLHLFTDGRDTPPKSALVYIQNLEDFLSEVGVGKIATIGGRYWGMDRDNNADRIEKYFQIMINQKGPIFKSAKEVVEASYLSGITDEFIEPAHIDLGQSELGIVKENDAVIFTSFRSDRTKQLAKRFVREKIKNLYYATMTKYADDLDVPVIFPPEEIKNTLSQVLSRNGLKQLRVTETDKFSHLTFYFNAQNDKPDKGEDRIMIESNKEVKTHDEKPEMKIAEVKEKIINALAEKKYDFIAVNLVNCDIVGHSGNFEAIKTAVTAVDNALGGIVKVAKANGVDVIITADHGNAEQVFDNEANQPHTAHTLNPVPFILISKEHTKMLSSQGLLSDIAPTILKMYGLEIPKEMTGTPLV